jgi:hypothetical protein
MVEWLLENGWGKPHKPIHALDPDFDVVWYKFVDIMPRCKDNDDKPGVQFEIGRYVGMLQYQPDKNPSYRIRLIARAQNNQQIKIETWLDEYKVEEWLDSIIEQFSAMWEAANSS